MPLIAEHSEPKKRSAPWWALAFVSVMLLPIVTLTPSVVFYQLPFNATLGKQQLILGRTLPMPGLDGLVMQTTHWNPATGRTGGGWGIFSPVWAYGITWSVKEPQPIGIPAIP
jgi:hypothetical protein